MVEKVTVNPKEVRCLGNIVSPKTLQDYNKYYCKITSGQDTINGDARTVYTSEYLTGSKLTLTAPHLVSIGAASFTVEATLKNNSNTAIASASLSCIVNDTITLTGTTNNSGSATFTVPVEEDVGDYHIRVIYEGTNSVSGCFLNTKVIVADLDELILITNKDIDITGNAEDIYLIATLTGMDSNDEVYPVPFQTISFYEEYTPGIQLKIPEIIDFAEDVNIAAQIIDATDASKVSLSGVTVSFYEEYTPGMNIIAPAALENGDTVQFVGHLIDADDNSNVSLESQTVNVYDESSVFNLLYSEHNYTGTSTNDKCYSIGLDDLSIDLSDLDFTLEFDWKFTSIGGRVVIGDVVSDYDTVTGSEVFIGTTSSNGGKFNYGYRISTTTSTNSNKTPSVDTNYHCKIIREGNTFSYYVDDTLLGTKSFSNFAGYEDFRVSAWIWNTGTQTISKVKLTIEED